MSTLIIPCAGRSTRFPGVRPKWMLTYPDGKLMLEKSMEGLAVPSLKRLIITVVKEHCEKYDADLIIKQVFGDKAEICILDDFTSSQSETVFLTIEKMNVNGGFIAKDSDGYVKVLVEEFDNFLVGVDLRKNMGISNVAGKSFLVLNEQNMIIDIVEKSVCSNIINIGVYGFRSAEDFVKYYEIVKKAWSSEKGEIYLSHVASYMIGQKEYFLYKETVKYEDWGLISDWHRVMKRKKTYFIDIDGVLFKNKGKYGRINWNNEDEPLENNINTVKKLVKEGAQLIFCTARPESYRKKLEQSLKKQDISWYKIVMACNHSQRVVINDFADTNPFPSCIAINTIRDADNIEKFLLYHNE